ncbi:hypothetical protein E2C01_078859 [Portunus trituberculatus]|uniref:Uncharacterized protein n=1 Tax=Portunus trituberculatus TaxID=210409 RepID=A0A5B7IJZ1_PORTR|nr:hypothetical protein [Portunus trituberculatus]
MKRNEAGEWEEQQPGGGRGGKGGAGVEEGEAWEEDEEVQPDCVCPLERLKHQSTFSLIAPATST